jgi:hypothetical protein
MPDSVTFQSTTPATPTAGEKVAVNHLSTGEDLQLVQIDLATPHGTSSPVTSANPFPVAMSGSATATNQATANTSQY